MNSLNKVYEGELQIRPVYDDGFLFQWHDIRACVYADRRGDPVVEFDSDIKALMWPAPRDGLISTVHIGMDGLALLRFPLNPGVRGGEGITVHVVVEGLLRAQPWGEGLKRMEALLGEFLTGTLAKPDGYDWGDQRSDDILDGIKQTRDDFQSRRDAEEERLRPVETDSDPPGFPLLEGKAGAFIDEIGRRANKTLRTKAKLRALKSVVAEKTAAKRRAKREKAYATISVGDTLAELERVIGSPRSRWKSNYRGQFLLTFEQSECYLEVHVATGLNFAPPWWAWLEVGRLGDYIETEQIEGPDAPAALKAMLKRSIERHIVLGFGCEVNDG